MNKIIECVPNFSEVRKKKSKKLLTASAMWRRKTAGLFSDETITEVLLLLSVSLLH
ncbi:MAG: hypothetical protein ACLTH0_00630 [Blautia producta]